MENATYTGIPWGLKARTDSLPAVLNAFTEIHCLNIPKVAPPCSPLVPIVEHFRERNLEFELKQDVRLDEKIVFSVNHTSFSFSLIPTRRTTSTPHFLGEIELITLLMKVQIKMDFFGQILMQRRKRRYAQGNWILFQQYTGSAKILSNGFRITVCQTKVKSQGHKAVIMLCVGLGFTLGIRGLVSGHGTTIQYRRKSICTGTVCKDASMPTETPTT